MTLRQRLLGCARACRTATLAPFVYQPPNPWLPVVVYGSAALACVVGNLLAGPPPIWAWVVLPLLGLFLWTLLEYVLHSRFFHDPPRLFHWMSISHGDHHGDPDNPKLMVGQLSFSFPIAVFLFGALSLIFWSVAWGALAFVGLAIGYLSYEVIHFSIHRVPWVRRLLRPLASHHLHHHYADSSRCFGVTVPLWDWVFRTGRRHRAARGSAPAVPASATNEAIP
jgi:sterol desaturase/sphingolipid hydroxylase (fatty acid hydroxylase superfamily)